jgi:hypothetical protein
MTDNEEKNVIGSDGAPLIRLPGCDVRMWGQKQYFLE